MHLRRSAGMTLIEIMIATVLTLLMMLALAQGFKTLSESVSAGRSKLTLSDQLRGISSLLRSDLEGMTVNSDNPQSSLARSGYFKYYDGPISDTSATLYNYLPTGNVEQRVAASRWGDIDDILMFTAKAKSGEWFHGKVPLALLIVNRLNSGWVPPGPINWADAWATDVTIASEYGEVVWFMRPLQASDVSATASPNLRYPINIQEIGPNYPPLPPETSVQDVTPGVDLDGDLIPDPDGMPDRVALCRRVLLIRPDLNISETVASAAAFSGADPQLNLKPLPVSPSSVDSFRYSLRFAYQRCDLSVRAITNEYVASSGTLTLQTNSLSDLQRPENRFAHYTIPLAAISLDSGTGTDTSLPILALTSEAGSTGNYLAMTNQIYGTLSPNSPSVSAAPTDRGFIPSSFFRTKIVVNTVSGNVASAVPTLEEVVASNVVAFDLKGYDLTVKQIASMGADNAWGRGAVDDDLDTAVDNVSEAGWPASDDLSLTPSDPGYSMALIRGAGLSGPAVAPTFSGAGAFVDIDWSRKVIHAPHRLSSGTLQLGMNNTNSINVSLWPSNLSCVQVSSTSQIQRTDNLAKSGSYFATPSLGVVAYQPCFDTFTDAYESDGQYMELVGSLGTDSTFVRWRTGLRRFGMGLGQDPLAALADQGSDGIGDDENQKETSPPIPFKLPSIQATIRVQDYTAGTLQQISVVHDLR